MDDALVVDVLECFGKLTRDVQDLINRERRMGTQIGPQRFAIDVPQHRQWVTPKPFDVQALVETVARVVEEPTAVRALLSIGQPRN